MVKDNLNAIKNAACPPKAKATVTSVAFVAQRIIKSHKTKKILFSIFTHALLIGLSFVVLYPILFMLSNAFKPHAQFRDPAVIWIPKSFTLDNFRDLFKVLDFGSAMINSVIYAVIPTFIQTALCMVVGYGFARFRFPGKKLIFGLVILTFIVPVQTISTGLYAGYRYFDPFGLMSVISAITGGALPSSLNLIGTVWVTILPALFCTALRSGLYIFILRQFFASMPKELEEAATVDGCGPVKTFLRIMAPNAMNIAITVLILGIVWNWNDFYTASTFIRSKYTVATALNEVQRSLANISTIGMGGAQNWYIIMTRIQAACLLGIAPLLVIYLFLQKHLTESIENAGLTGM